jgi:hypothetical protein
MANSRPEVLKEWQIKASAHSGGTLDKYAAHWTYEAHMGSFADDLAVVNVLWVTAVRLPRSD